MEMMCTAYAKSGIQSEHVWRQTITQLLWRESTHPLITTFQYVAELCDGGKGAFEMHHSFLYFIGTQCLVHLRTVYASPPKLAWPLPVTQILSDIFISSVVQQIITQNFPMENFAGRLQCEQQQEKFKKGVTVMYPHEIRYVWLHRNYLELKRMEQPHKKASYET